MVPRLLAMFSLPGNNPAASDQDRAEMQYQSIRIISILIKFDKQWIKHNYVIILNLNKIWCNDEYLVRLKFLTAVKVPFIIILL